MNGVAENSIYGNQEHKTQSSDMKVISGLLSDEEKSLNKNKPWRIVVRRIVSDGGSNYEDIYGDTTGNQSV